MAVLETVCTLSASVESRAIFVGTLDRFNNGKRAEEHDRVKHAHV